MRGYISENVILFPAYIYLCDNKLYYCSGFLMTESTVEETEIWGFIFGLFCFYPFPIQSVCCSLVPLFLCCVIFKLATSRIMLLICKYIYKSVESGEV